LKSLIKEAVLLKALRTTFLTAVLLSSVAAAVAGPAKICSTSGGCPYKSQREAINTLLAQESEHRWKSIQWRTDAAQCLKEAQARSKPIFLFFVVKQLAPSPSKWSGQKDDTGET
jgi:hypothetical protein